MYLDTMPLIFRICLILFYFRILLHFHLFCQNISGFKVTLLHFNAHN